MSIDVLQEEGGDCGPYHDFAVITSNCEVIFLNGVADANDGTSAELTINGVTFSWAEESGYITLTGDVVTGGSYEIGIGVMNEGDDIEDSGLLLDNLIVTRGDSVVIEDDFTSFANWQVVGGGFVAIVGDIGTNESMAEGGAPTQGLLIAGGPIDLGACGCKVIVSSLTYNEANGTPVGGEYGDELDLQADQPQGGEYGDDCTDRKRGG